MTTPNTPPAATIVQCQSCSKQLKYIGRKPLINCPSCGSIVEITKQQPSPPPPPIDWAALSSDAKKREEEKPQGKKIEFSPLEIQAIKVVNKIKAAQPVSMHLALIWCIWAVWALMVIWSTFESFTRMYPSSNGMIHTEFGWKDPSEFLFLRFVSSLTMAFFLAFIAAIPTFLIWNYNKLKSPKPENQTDPT